MLPHLQVMRSPNPSPKHTGTRCPGAAGQTQTYILGAQGAVDELPSGMDGRVEMASQPFTMPGPSCSGQLSLASALRSWRGPWKDTRHLKAKVWECPVAFSPVSASDGIRKLCKPQAGRTKG